MLECEALTESIIGAAIEVHREVGPGLLESAYEAFLCRELDLRGLRYRTQVEVPVMYKGVKLECGYRVDLIVEEQVIVEIKAVEKVLPVHEAQLITYMKLTGKRVGLLLNFHETVLRKGLIRRVL